MNVAWHIISHQNKSGTEQSPLNTRQQTNHHQISAYHW
jgi:hypothetical protein